MALGGCGIIRVPLHAVKAEITDKRLEVILKDVSLSPERMCAYHAKVKPLPAKTADFITFLANSILR
jgi:DNA-binding transcriptional LysR family regulator